MSLGIVRGMITLILFVAFISLWIWAWSTRRRPEFSAAAQIPLQGDPHSPDGSTGA